MKDNNLSDYLLNYIPRRIGKMLAEDPIPGMAGTIFTLQITITGDQCLTFGITICDALHITVTSGEIDNPMVTLTLPDDFLRPVVRLISTMAGKNQYETIRETKGSVDMEIRLSGGDTLPVRAVFNCADEPNFRLSGSSHDLGRMATGAVDPTQAFMEGTIKLNGDISFALKLSQLAMKK